MAAPGGPQQFHPESLSELARYVQYMLVNYEKQLNTLSARIEQIENQARENRREDSDHLRAQIKKLEEDIEKYRNRQTQQTRWVIGSIVFPLVGLILTAYSMLQGVS